MNDLPKDVDIQDPLLQQALRDVAADSLASALGDIQPCKGPAACSVRQTHGRVILARRSLTVALLVLLGLNFLALLRLVIPPSSALAVLAILVAMAVASLTVSEMLLGAGWHVEAEWRTGNGFRRTYSFRPAIRHARELLLIATLPIVTAVVAFSALYLSLASGLSDAFSAPISSVSALYFSIVTFATVGFGDIVPTSDVSRLAVTCEIICAFFLVAVTMAVSLSWLVGQTQAKLASRREANRRAMQLRESLLKRKRLGLYAPTGTLENAVLQRVAELRRNAKGEATDANVQDH